MSTNQNRLPPRPCIQVLDGGKPYLFIHLTFLWNFLVDVNYYPTHPTLISKIHFISSYLNTHSHEAFRFNPKSPFGKYILSKVCTSIKTTISLCVHFLLSTIGFHQDYYHRKRIRPYLLKSPTSHRTYNAHSLIRNRQLQTSPTPISIPNVPLAPPTYPSSTVIPNQTDIPKKPFIQTSIALPIPPPHSSIALSTSTPSQTESSPIPLIPRIHVMHAEKSYYQIQMGDLWNYLIVAGFQNNRPLPILMPYFRFIHYYTHANPDAALRFNTATPFGKAILYNTSKSIPYTINLCIQYIRSTMGFHKDFYHRKRIRPNLLNPKDLAMGMVAGLVPMLARWANPKDDLGLKK